MTHTPSGYGEMPRRAFLWPVIVAAFVVGAAWAAAIPSFEGPDEYAHYQAAMKVRRARSGNAVAVVENPAFQAERNQRGHLNAFMHGSLERTAGGDAVRLYGLRALTVAAWTMSLLLIFETARLVFRSNQAAFVVAGLALSLPGATFVFSTAQPAAFGVLIGSALYWALTAHAVGRIGRLPVWIIAAAAVGAAVGFHVVSTIWLAISPAVHSTPYVWWPSDALPYTLFEFLPRLWLGLVGWLGQQSLLLPAAVYAAFAAAFVVGVCGVIWRLRVAPLDAAQRRISVLFAAGLTLTIASLLCVSLLWDRTTAAAPWLYASLGPIMITLVAGWRSAAVLSRRSPGVMSMSLATLAAALAAIWFSNVADLQGDIRFHYTGDADHFARTVRYLIAFLCVAAAVWLVWAQRQGSSTPRPGGQRPYAIVAMAWTANLLLLVGFVTPRYAPLDADGLALAVREAAADDEVGRATSLYRLAASAYPESASVSQLLIDVPALDVEGAHDPMFLAIRARLARGELLTNRAELILLARNHQTRQLFGSEILRVIANHIAKTRDLQEPRELIAAQADHRIDGAAVADAIRAMGGTVAAHNVHDDAALDGFTSGRGASGRNEVTLYFHPLRPWRGRHLWVHAYPEGSREYEPLLQISPMYAEWRTGALAWETFALPSNAAYVLYVGVQVDQDLGAAYPIGTVR